MRDAEKGIYNDVTTFCTVNAYGDCPYCDADGICHIDDPVADCDDFAVFFETWEEWMGCADHLGEPWLSEFLGEVHPTMMEENSDE